MVMRPIFLLAIFSLLGGLTFSQVPKANLGEFHKDIGPVLEAACVQCHGPKKQKAKFRVDTFILIF